MRQITFWLSLLMIFAIPWENSAKFDGLGSLAKLFGLATAGMWVATVARTGELRRFGYLHVLAFLFILWNCASIFWTFAIDETLSRAITYGQTLVLVIVLWDVYRTPASLRAGMQAYVFGACVSIGLLAHAYFVEGGADARRLTVAGFNPNVIAFGLVLGIPMAWYLTHLDPVVRPGFLRRWINLGYIPLATLGIILAGARSALVSAGVACCFMLWSVGQLRPMARASLLVAIVACPLLALPYITWEKIDRIASLTYEVGDGTYGGRNATWAEGMELLAAAPWLGIGSGAYSTAAVETRKAPHNFVVAILTELGVIGMVLFGAILFASGLAALRQERWLCRLWLTMLLMWGLNAAVHNYEDKKHTWVFFSFVAIGAALAEPYAGVARRASTRKPAREPSTTPATAPTAT